MSEKDKPKEKPNKPLVRTDAGIKLVDRVLRKQRESIEAAPLASDKIQ